MRRRTLLVAPALLLAGRRGWAAVPPDRTARLMRGVNLTNWFRFPVAPDRTSFEGWITDAELGALRTAGFDHVRLPVHDDVVVPGGQGDALRLDLLRRQVQRLRAAGFAVMVVPYMRGRGPDWRPETDAAARDRLVRFWAVVAPVLGREPASHLFPEAVNEAVFTDRPEEWLALLERVVATIRQAMPGHSIVASPGQWASVQGLRGFRPVRDSNVIYSIHSYEPTVFATLASGAAPDLDRGALARLPWPVRNGADCAAAQGTAHAVTRDLVGWFCGGAKDRAWLRSHFQPMIAFGNQHGVPMHLGEFGVSPRLAAEARRAFIADVVAVMAEARTGWALWGFEDSMGLGRQRPERGRPGRIDPAGLLPALGLRPVGPA
jgi:hypothetical protein